MWLFLWRMPLLPTLGTVYVATLAINWDVLWIAIPVGLITVAILHANNTRDMYTDARANISTLAMRLGGKVSVFLYCAEILFPFGWVGRLCRFRDFPLVDASGFTGFDTRYR